MATKKTKQIDRVFVGAFFPRKDYNAYKAIAKGREQSMSAFVRLACLKLAREIEEAKR